MKSKKVLSQAALARRLRAVRRKKIVFTNGCFDLLHAGHARYLAKAKALGDILVVAVNSDRSVRRLKGRGRPYVVLRFRMEMIAALQSVDFVTSFDEITPAALVRRLTPHVMVKGADYSVGQIAGAGHVLKHGGKVQRVRLVGGLSTTALVARIRRAGR